ncbi:MAG: 2-hydroxyhepta-2,4-diene-1,7-dioate isomerase [Bacteroidetes bacterium 4572_77]|nr:MAG: 2-hydroxyhepta-2,4-diene-1,7-dioate isomerase [Bacteroidetes bacterium 4572_77]
MKIICIGRNYVDHAKELHNVVPEKPVFFLKPETALLKRNQPFFYPDFSKDIHYELELVVRINKIGLHIQEQFAHAYYQEVGLGIDFTARDLQNEQKKKGLPWEIAKAFDHSAPISSFVDKDELGDVQNQQLTLYKNDKIVQHGNTVDMIFSIDKIISYVSRFVSFKIGDLIFTGTPAGVGPVQIGDHLKGFLGEREMISFDIK